MKIKHYIGLSVFLSFFAFNANANAQCGKLTIAEMPWESSKLMAHVDTIILEEGYGCAVELEEYNPMDISTSMTVRGQPDMSPELWINSTNQPLLKAVKEGILEIPNKNPILGEGEGWWITAATVEKYPQIKGMTVLEILDNPGWFPHPEDSSKGAFMGCPDGWACHSTNENLFRAFEMEKKGWKLVVPGSGAVLKDSIVKADKSGDAWFGYYWSPSAIVGKYDLIPVDFGVPYAGDDNWNKCIIKPEQECADPKPTAWIENNAHTIVTSQFSNKAGTDVMTYIKKRTYPVDVMNKMLAFMVDEQASGNDAATEFLVKHADVWTKWVPAGVAEKVKAGLY